MTVLFATKLPRRLLLMVTTGIVILSIFVVGCLGIPDAESSYVIGKVIINSVVIEIAAFNFAWGPLGWTIVSSFLLSFSFHWITRFLNFLSASEMAVGRNRNKIYAVAVACF